MIEVTHSQHQLVSYIANVDCQQIPSSVCEQLDYEEIEVDAVNVRGGDPVYINLLGRGYTKGHVSMVNWRYWQEMESH